jgi:hypothetical protein
MSFSMWVMYWVWGMLTAVGAVGLLGVVVGLFAILYTAMSPFHYTSQRYLKLVGWSVLSLVVGIASVVASAVLWAQL